MFCCEYLNRRGGGPLDHHEWLKRAHFFGDRNYGVQTHLQGLTLLHHAAAWGRLNVVNSVAVELALRQVQLVEHHYSLKQDGHETGKGGGRKKPASDHVGGLPE